MHSSCLRKMALTLLVAGSVVAATGVAQTDPVAVNYVIASERLHTAGQPDVRQLRTLADRGFGLVVNLAPPTTENAVPTEGQLVTETGVAYLNIPVDWRNPSYADFELFSGVLNQSGNRRVLVHCMVNARASMFTFLYRTVHERVPPEEAFQAVTAVWEPSEQWVQFGETVLERHGIEFEFP